MIDEQLVKIASNILTCSEAEQNLKNFFFNDLTFPNNMYSVVVTNKNSNTTLATIKYSFGVGSFVINGILQNNTIRFEEEYLPEF